jgi:hypothetical protein
MIETFCELGTRFYALLTVRILGKNMVIARATAVSIVAKIYHMPVQAYVYTSRTGYFGINLRSYFKAVKYHFLAQVLVILFKNINS